MFVLCLSENARSGYFKIFDQCSHSIQKLKLLGLQGNIWCDACFAWSCGRCTLILLNCQLSTTTHNLKDNCSFRLTILYFYYPVSHAMLKCGPVCDCCRISLPSCYTEPGGGGCTLTAGAHARITDGFVLVSGRVFLQLS